MQKYKNLYFYIFQQSYGLKILKHYTIITNIIKVKLLILLIITKKIL